MRGFRKACDPVCWVAAANRCVCCILRPPAHTCHAAAAAAAAWCPHRYHYGKFASARAQEAAKADVDEEAAEPLKGDSKQAAQQQQDGYRTRGSWAGGDK
jgi:hypothetical protein